MATLRINDFEYKPVYHILVDISKEELDYKTDFWIGKMKINGLLCGNTCTIIPGEKYFDYLNSKFAKIQSAKLYLKVNQKVIDDTFEGVNLVYKFQKVKTISEFQNDYLVIEFSSVLRNMMKDTLCNPRGIKLEIKTSTTNYIVFDKEESYIEIEYVPIGNTKSNRPSLKHDFGHIDLIEGSNHSRIFDIDCQALSIHHIYNSKRNINENYNCGKRWSLNINQKLVKDNTYTSENFSTLYLYQDGTGTIEELEERFYIDDNENRVYVNKKDVKILDNGILEYTYKNKPYVVNVEHVSKKGLTLKTDITEYKKDISLELRDEDVANLEEQIKALEKQQKEIKQSLELLKENKDLEKLSKEIRTLENLLENQVLPSDMNTDECIQYKEIKDRIFALEKEYNSYLNEYNKEYYNTAETIYLDNQIDGYLDNTFKLRTEFFERFKSVKNDENYKWANYEKTLNEINVNNYLQALRKKLSDMMADISKRYYTLSD